MNRSIESRPEYFDVIDRVSMNCSVKSLIRYYDKGCLDFEAPYQRDVVWSLKQKRSYIMALFHHKALITPTLILDDDMNLETDSNDLHFIVLDGKQRLSSIIDFYYNEYSVLVNEEEVFFKDLVSEDKAFVESLDVNYTRISYLKKLVTVPMDIQFELFLELNALGTKQSDEHLDSVRQMKEELKPSG